MFLSCALLVPAAYGLLGDNFGYYPAAPERHRELLPPIESELRELEKYSANLQNRLADPKRLTLADVGPLVEETLSFSRKLAGKSVEQQVSISNLTAQVLSERARAEEATRIAHDVRSLAKKQIDAVKTIITDDAEKASEKGFVLGVICSFPTGFLTSLLASWIYGRISSSRRW
jgi:hypothetical protein